MPLTPLEAFKCGFLSRCIEDRLTPEQTAASVKRACDFMEKQGVLDKLVGGAMDVGKDALGLTARLGIPAAVLAPWVLGGAGGYGLAKAVDIDDNDVDEIKNREVVDEYNRQAEKLERQKAVRDFLRARQKTPRIYM